MPETEADQDQSMSRTFIVQDGMLSPSKPEGAADSSQALSPGIVIDSKYKIISLLGQGGMGSVYLAHHLLLDKDMALKTFRSRQIDKDASQRFEREARAIAKLSHKNIVQVFDFGVTSDGLPFYTMELLGGTSLVKYIRDRSLSLRETLEIFVEVAEGLAHAHKVGISHRDIKPDNIHLGAPKGKAGKISSVKIVDFGIAKLALESRLEVPSQQDQMQTKVGRVFGSPFYMSPEQSIGEPTDHRTDIYSFGCTLFEAITGRPPFVGENSRATLSLHRLEAPPTLARSVPDQFFPQRLEALLARLLEKEKIDRFQSFIEVRQEISRILATLADGHAAGQSTIAQKAETSLRSDLLRQAQTDPRVTADRAFLKVLQTNRKIILPAILAGSLALALLAVFILHSGKNRGPDGLGQKANLSQTPAAPKEAPAFSSFSPKADTDRSLPPGKYLLRQTATSKIFKFPSNGSIGQLHFRDSEVQASGQVEIPKDCNCTLVAQHLLSVSPQLLNGFGVNDLTEIYFSPAFNWKDAHLKWVGKLSGLQALDVDDCDLTATGIAYIGNLSNLRKICIGGAHQKAADWSHLRQLSAITEIKVEDLDNISALLKKLQQQNSLERLEVKDTELSDADMLMIGGLKRLAWLKLSGTRITRRGLKALMALPNLSDINISQSIASPDSIEILAALPALRKLEIGTGDWGLANQRRIYYVMQAKKVLLKQICSESKADQF
jgi:serine/threonine protein kinase